MDGDRLRQRVFEEIIECVGGNVARLNRVTAAINPANIAAAHVSAHAGAIAAARAGTDAAARTHADNWRRWRGEQPPRKLSLVVLSALHRQRPI